MNFVVSMDIMDTQNKHIDSPQHRGKTKYNLKKYQKKSKITKKSTTLLFRIAITNTSFTHMHTGHFEFAYMLVLVSGCWCWYCYTTGYGSSNKHQQLQKQLPSYANAKGIFLETYDFGLFSFLFFDGKCLLYL